MGEKMRETEKEWEKHDKKVRIMCKKWTSVSARRVVTGVCDRAA